MTEQIFELTDTLCATAWEVIKTETTNEDDLLQSLP